MTVYLVLCGHVLSPVGTDFWCFTPTALQDCCNFAACNLFTARVICTGHVPVPVMKKIVACLPIIVCTQSTVLYLDSSWTPCDSSHATP